jgi:hypothetical protein
VITWSVELVAAMDHAFPMFDTPTVGGLYDIVIIGSCAYKTFPQ